MQFSVMIWPRANCSLSAVFPISELHMVWPRTHTNTPQKQQLSTNIQYSTRTQQGNADTNDPFKAVGSVVLSISSPEDIRCAWPMNADNTHIPPKPEISVLVECSLHVYREQSIFPTIPRFPSHGSRRNLQACRGYVYCSEHRLTQAYGSDAENKRPFPPKPEISEWWNILRSIVLDVLFSAFKTQATHTTILG